MTSPLKRVTPDRPPIPRFSRWLWILVFFTPFQAIHSQTSQTEAHPLKHYVMIFRATRTLSPEEQQRRAGDLRQWIQQVKAMTIHVEPRNLGAFAEQLSLEGTSVVSRQGAGDSSIVTLVFFDAPNDEQAMEVARLHPGPRYGVKLELRDWAPPQVSLAK